MSRRIRFLFDERKATEAAAHLLKRAGGRMSYLKLVKLLYLAERRSLRNHRRPICGDTYFALKDGPIMSAILDLIRKSEWGDPPRYWPHHINTHEYDVALERDIEIESLSRADLETLDAVFDSLGQMDRWALRDWTHKNCPEWRDPGQTRLPIFPEDILEATGATEEDISEMCRHADERRRLLLILPEKH